VVASHRTNEGAAVAVPEVLAAGRDSLADEVETTVVEMTHD
jgi:hypothetical protein